MNVFLYCYGSEDLVCLGWERVVKITFGFRSPNNIVGSGWDEWEETIIIISGPKFGLRFLWLEEVLTFSVLRTKIFEDYTSPKTPSHHSDLLIGCFLTLTALIYGNSYPRILSMIIPGQSWGHKLRCPFPKISFNWDTYNYAIMTRGHWLTFPVSMEMLMF